MKPYSQQRKDTQKAMLSETRQRRTTQVCKTYSLKIDRSHLSKAHKHYLDMLYREAKWLTNGLIASEDLSSYHVLSKEVMVLNKDCIQEYRTLTFLSSQMKQGIYQRFQGSIRSLSTRKKNGFKIGPLKFKSQVNSIPLTQYQNTYKFTDNRKYLRLQGTKLLFKIQGHNQIPLESEITSANLIRKQGDFYLKITTFQSKQEHSFPGTAIGIDFGIKTSLTLSNEQQYNVLIPIPDRIRKLHRRLSKKQLKSKNWYKAKTRLEQAYADYTNQKNDIRHKIVHDITRNYETVIFQDESIKGWQSGWFGKRISQSCLGGIMYDLKHRSSTPIMVEKWFPSTQLCPSCGCLNKHDLNERIYHCPCGYQDDRDTHAAKNILNEGLRKQFGTDRIKTMPGEPETSDIKFIKSLVMSQEAKEL